MKYCEVVRDIASKPGDWSFYDEQFRYIRQSAPDQYHWDTIHWELWLRAVTNFRARPQVPSDKVSTRSRNGQSFPKGTCWAFHAGRFCGGCRYDHVCFKCGSPHPASQCSSPSSQRAPPPPPLPTPEPNKPIPLLSSPVTPVRVERLDFLLQGYAPALKQYLIDGFSFGFRIKFMGKGALSNPLI